MIDGVEGAGKCWGWTKRRILAGGYFRDEDSFHVDGHATRSHLAKLWEEREGAAHDGLPSQRWPEVFVGDSLAFERAIEGAREHWFWLAHIRYVIPNARMHPKSKLTELRELFPRQFKDERAYFNELHAMHCYLLGRMQLFSSPVVAA